MAMPPLLLVFIGSLATLATIGIGLDIADRPTKLLVTFSASLLWGLFGLSSFDVIVMNSAGVMQVEAIEPVAYLGILLSMVVGLFAMFQFLQIIGSTASDIGQDPIQ